MKIGFTELILVFVVALIVIGPDKLPGYAKKLGEALAIFKKASDEATREIKENITEPLEEAARPLREAMEPVEELNRAVRGNVRDVQNSINRVGRKNNKDNQNNQSDTASDIGDMSNPDNPDLKNKRDSNQDANQDSNPDAETENNINNNINNIENAQVKTNADKMENQDIGDIDAEGEAAHENRSE